MILDIFIYLFGFFLLLITKILPEWVIWPDMVINGINYFASYCADLNFILPIDTLFKAGIFYLNFVLYYITAKLILMGINWFRGSGKIDI
jgi:hypothetical protein